MSRTRPLTALTAVAALAGVAAATPAPASATVEDVAYESQSFRARPSGEQVTLDVPADWERNRLNRVSVGFFDHTAPARSIVVDLAPLADTVREVRAERRELQEVGPRGYREHGFRVHDAGSPVRARWVYSYRDAQTDDTWSYTSVLLMRGNRVVVDGRRSQLEELAQIRRHVVASVRFAS